MKVQHVSAFASVRNRRGHKITHHSNALLSIAATGAFQDGTRSARLEMLLAGGFGNSTLTDRLVEHGRRVRQIALDSERLGLCVPNWLRNERFLDGWRDHEP